MPHGLGDGSPGCRKRRSERKAPHGTQFFLKARAGFSMGTGKVTSTTILHNPSLGFRFFSMVRLLNDEPPLLWQNHHMRLRNVRTAVRLVEAHQQRFLKEWRRLHGQET